MVKEKEGKKKEVNENTLETITITGFILGVLSILFMGAQGLIMAIVGLVFSGYAHNKKKTKITLAGVILNIIGLVVGIILIIIIFMYADQIFSQMGNQI